MQNIIQLQKSLERVPDDALVGYVQNPQGQVPSYLALTELGRRKTMREEAQNAQVPKQTVAQALVQETQPQPQMGVMGLPGAPQETAQMIQQLPQQAQHVGEQGVAGLPTGDMYDEQNFAGGGIVAFGDGGDVDTNYADGGYVPGFAGPEGSYVNPGMYGKPTGQSFLDKLRFGFSSPDEIRKANMGEGMPQNPFMGYMPDANRDPMTLQFQIKQLYDQLKDPNADKYAIYQKINELEGRNKDPYKMGGYELTKQDLAPVQPGKPKDDGKGKGGGRSPFDALMTKEKSLKELSDEYMGILGEDKGAKRLSERLAKMDEKAAEQEKQAPWLALAKAGFEMANSRAEYGKGQSAAADIGRGATAGIKDYAESKEALNKLEEKRFVLDNELSKQARVEQVAALKYGQDSKQHTEEMNKTIQLAKLREENENARHAMDMNVKVLAASQKGAWDKKDYFKAYNEVAGSDAFQQAEKAYVNDKGSWVKDTPQYNQWKDLTIKQLIRQSESPSGTTADAWTNFKKSN